MINIKQQQDRRISELEAWLAGYLPNVDWQLKPLINDASFRRYFRVCLGDGKTYVAMDAPPDKEPMAPFVAIASMLEKLHLNIPSVYQADLKQGFLLLRDLGDITYGESLNADNVDQLYQTAMQALLCMQANLSIEDHELPAFDWDFCQNELSNFREWFLQTHLGLELNAQEQVLIQSTFDQLTEKALAQTQVFVHRDYHSRNLMVLPESQVGILDFQDAVKGPVTYDLVSLLRDCYIDWPPEKVERWVVDFQQQAFKQGVLTENNPQQFLSWFDWMGMQRHLKAIFIFARLQHRDNKSLYLSYIPRALGYVTSVCQRYAELKPFYQFLQNRVLKQ